MTFRSSSRISLERGISGNQIAEEGGEGAEPPALKIQRTRELVAKTSKERLGGADQPATAQASNPESKEKPRVESEAPSQ